MPRYYFDVSSGPAATASDGMDLRDDGHAHHEALHRVAQFACDAGNLKAPGAAVVTVRNDAGSVVLIVRLVCSTEVPGELEEPTIR